MVFLERSLRLRPATGADRHPAWRAGLACALLGLAGGLLGGCGASSSSTPPVSSPAEFVVVNLSDRSWEIGLTAAEGVAQRWRLEPWATRSGFLPAGKYRGDQVLLAAHGGAETSRQLEILLESGKSYRWRLTTLRSEAAAREPVRSETEAAAR